MQLDQNPFFRKAITPWYDSNLSCWILISLLIFVLIFAAAGIYVALNTAAFSPHAWFPGLLASLSLFLIVKIYLRLKRRAKND